MSLDSCGRAQACRRGPSAPARAPLSTAAAAVAVLLELKLLLREFIVAVVRARPAGVRAAAGPRARPSRPGRGPVRRSTDRDAIIGPGALSMYVPLPRRPSRARRAFELNYKNGCAAGAAPEHHRVAFSQKTRFLPHPRWNTGREASEINRQREISACAKR